MKKYLLLSFICTWALSSVAQLSNDSLEYRIRPDSARTGSVYLHINNFNFLRNYEFFNSFQDGYTLYGTQLDPQISYYPHPKLVITAGVSLRKDYGNQGIRKTLPLFSLKYKSGPLTFITGSLEGSINHRMIEPIYDFERRITNPVEYGTQFIWEKKSLFVDAFINWDNMIYRPSGEQERIFAGGSADITLKNSGRLKLSIPIQAMLFHAGGQIDTTDLTNKLTVNAATGFKLKYDTQGQFIRSLLFENYIVGFKDNSTDKLWAFDSGKAFYLNAGVKSRWGDLILSYWNADKYASVTGMQIFQSVGHKLGQENYTEARRNLLFLRYAYQKQLIPHLYLDFRLEPVIDFKSPTANNVEFYHSLFVVYKQDFRLYRKK